MYLYANCKLPNQFELDIVIVDFRGPVEFELVYCLGADASVVGV
jgi:hypothetical protein